jgi:hypothetical protein
LWAAQRRGWRLAWRPVAAGASGHPAAIIASRRSTALHRLLVNKRATDMLVRERLESTGNCGAQVHGAKRRAGSKPKATELTRGLPGGVSVGSMDPSHSAGTADIAKDSGGDVMEVDSASAFQDTLERLRQRYALYFYWPPGPANPEERLVRLALSASAGAEFREAEVRYRRAYLGQTSGSRSRTLMEVSREPDSADPTLKNASARDRDSDATATSPGSSTRERRPAVNEDSNLGPNPMLDNSAGDPHAAEAQPAPVKQNSAKTDPSLPPQPRRGWPRVGESPQQ